MQPKAREVLHEALERYGAEGAKGFFEKFGEHPARRSEAGAGSRQARHARLQRQRALAAAGTLSLVHRDPTYADVLISPEFARLRPYSAAVHTRALHLASETDAFAEAETEVVLGRVLPRYVDLVRRASTLGRDDLLAIHALQAAMTLRFHLFHGPQVRDAWRYLRAELRRAGVLDHPSTRLWIAIVGSHAGESGPHVDWLLSPHLHDFDLADTLCFVRKDASEDLLDQTAAIIRGGDTSSSRWRPVAYDAPTSAWLRLADYVCACSRMSVHCSSEGQVLMVLSWVEDLQRRLASMTREVEGVRAATGPLLLALRRIESVQILEKNRFHRVLSQASSGVLRERLKTLWAVGSHVAEDSAEAE